ncbi:uncharacterized protein LOC144450005 [Glandiceps talaboti]
MYFSSTDGTAKSVPVTATSGGPDGATVIFADGSYTAIAASLTIDATNCQLYSKLCVAIIVADDDEDNNVFCIDFGITADKAGTKVCSDINECAVDNGGCADICTNTVALFSCACGIGYTLNSDGLACDDIDECHIGNDGCIETCTNTIGSFRCSCNTGYTMNANGSLCVDVDECASNNGGCTDLCSNTLGSFTCYCGTGYTLNADNLTCDDLGKLKSQWNQSSPLVPVLSSLIVVLVITLVISLVFVFILKRRLAERSELDKTSEHTHQAKTSDVHLEMSEEIGRTGSTNQTYEVEMPDEAHYKNKNVSAENVSSTKGEEDRRTRDSTGLPSEGIYETMPEDTDIVPEAKDSEGYMSLIR